MISQPNGHVSWLQIFQHGQKYMKTWPQEKRLAPVFPEYRVSKVTRFALQVMPPIAIFSLVWQITLGGSLGSTLATALFACSLPLQGLWWLGKRAITPLPPSLLLWFHQLRDKLTQAGKALAPLEGSPTYQQLAEVLQRAFKQLDKTFLDDI